MLPSSAQVEIWVQLSFVPYPHENTIFKLLLFLALRFGGSAQLQEILHIHKLAFVACLWFGSFVLVLHFFILVDLWVTEGFRVEGHFPEFFCFVYRSLFFQFLEIMHWGLARTGCSAAAGVINYIKRVFFDRRVLLYLHNKFIEADQEEISIFET